MITTEKQVKISWSISRNYVRVISNAILPITETATEKRIRFAHFSLKDFLKKQQNIELATPDQSSFANALLSTCLEGIPIIHFIDFWNGFLAVTKNSAISWEKSKPIIEAVFKKHIPNVEF